jgi:hypothetical protein
VGLVAVVCAITFAWAARDAQRQGFLTLRSYPYLVPTVLLGAFKAVTYVYPGVTSAVISIFSCKQLDSPASVAGEVVAAQGVFWSKVGGEAAVAVLKQLMMLPNCVYVRHGLCNVVCCAFNCYTRQCCAANASCGSCSMHARG